MSRDDSRQGRARGVPERDAVRGEIRSPSNPHVKHVVRLRERKHRDRTGEFVIDGVREVFLAIEGRIILENVFIHEPMLDSDAARDLYERVEQAGARTWLVSERAYERLAYGSRREGVVATGIRPSQELSGLSTGPRSLFIVVQGVEKPGNLGALIRSADAAGVDGIIVCDPLTDVYNPNAIRASLGTLFTSRIAVDESGKAIQWLKSRSIQIVAASPHGHVLYTDADYTGPTAIVLGSEHEGLTRAWTDAADVCVRIPMRGHADSLNLAISAAVLLFEAVRQRDTVSSPGE